jgi:hypothetical protein
MGTRAAIESIPDKAPPTVEKRGLRNPTRAWMIELRVRIIFGHRRTFVGLPSGGPSAFLGVSLASVAPESINDSNAESLIDDPRTRIGTKTTRDRPSRLKSGSISARTVLST